MSNKILATVRYGDCLMILHTWPYAQVGQGGAARPALDRDASRFGLDAGSGHHNARELDQLAHAVTLQVPDGGADLITLERHVDVLHRLIV